LNDLTSPREPTTLTKEIDVSKKLSALVMSMTIWDEHGKLDEPAMRKHLGRIKEAGAKTYIGSSASGDAFAMTDDEWNHLLSIAAGEFKGLPGFRVLGPEPRTVEQVQHFVKLVEPYKPEALQIYALDLGHSVRPTVKELEHYYETIIAGTDLNIVLSYFDTLGIPLPLDLIEKLAAKYKNVIGFVYSGHDRVELPRTVLRLRDRLELHCAGPWNAMTLLNLGGTGFMGFEGNISPELVMGVINAFAAGDMETLKTNYGKLVELSAMHMPYSGSSGRSVKPMLNAFGLPAGALKPPRMPVSSDIVDRLILETIKLDLPNFPKQRVR
jgi:dihydrodipicolinate synthase/N-acetylneuraminate lyase